MKHVLDVGQCSFDHAAIRDLIESNFDAQVTRADSAGEALDLLRRGNYDLVFVNRKLDADSSDGLEIIQAMKAEPPLAAVRVMLLTNYPQYQQQAVAAGAEPGFGKSQLDERATLERLSK